jgi:uncharacterized protein
MRRILVAAVLLGAAVGQVFNLPADQTGARSESPSDSCRAEYCEIPTAAIKVPLPDVQQPDDYSCGVASLMAILAYYGMPPDDLGVLKKKLCTTKKNGTDYRHIVKYAKDHGLEAEARPNLSLAELLGLLAAHKPVICSIQAYDEDHPAGERPKIYKDKDENGHYVVAIGYDEQNIFFMDPSLTGRRGYLPKSEFVDRWHDEEGTTDKPNPIQQLGLVIWKEGTVPKTQYARRID